MSLRRAWEANAADWARWARAPGHDSYWRFHRRRFLELLPAPGGLTLDLGCGEGRVARDLRARGHRVIGVDGSPTLALAATHEQPQPVVVADAARLPLPDDTADLVVAFMSLHDVDHLDAAVLEVGRVLRPGGRLCAAIVHPVSSAGSFEGRDDDRDAPFVIRGSYVDEHHYSQVEERDGLRMTFHSAHRPLEAYSRGAGTGRPGGRGIREVPEDDQSDRWSRVPLFLHLRARAAGSSGP